jgi:small GTP-binding protein
MSWRNVGALKICVLGDSGVGKTALVRRMAEGPFEERHITTVGAETRAVSIRIVMPGFSKELRQKLVLWDVTGHGRPEALGPFLRGAHAAFVVADATRIDTQLNMGDWVEGIKRAAGCLPVMLVINKTDIIGPGFDAGQVAEIAREYGAPYRLASALTGRNVAAALSDLVVRRRRPMSVIERRPAGPQMFPRPMRTGGRFDRWDFSAGSLPAGAGPAGWPYPHGLRMAGSTWLAGGSTILPAHC